MTLDYLPGEVWRGNVDYVYPTLDEKTRSVKVRMRFGNPQHKLKPNMFAQITIQSRLSEPVVLIPREALIRTGNSNRAVLALGEGKFKSVEVTIGRYDDTHFEVIKGLSEGEKVVASAQFLLDSESSKTSDFMRMEDKAWEQAHVAEVMGVINHVNEAERTLNVSREAIEKWGRGPDTLDFSVAEAIDMKALKAGMSIHFRFRITPQRDFIIDQIHAMDRNREMNHD